MGRALAGAFQAPSPQMRRRCRARAVLVFTRARISENAFERSERQRFPIPYKPEPLKVAEVRGRFAGLNVRINHAGIMRLQPRQVVEIAPPAAGTDLLPASRGHSNAMALTDPVAETTALASIERAAQEIAGAGETVVPC